MKRIIIAGIVGGIATFIGSFIFHMVLPFGTMGIQSLPNEDVIVASLKQGITQPGLYFFPGMDMSSRMTKEQEQAWTAKHKAGPVGILVYHPVGEEPMSPGQLLTELGTDLIAALLAALIISTVGAPYFARFLLVLLFGVIAWLSISVSYWNWFGYPGSYIIAEGMDQVLSWGFGGLVIPAIVKSPNR
jgi:hypothetical protein